MTVQPLAEHLKHSCSSQARTVAILESSAKMGGIQHTTLALAANLDRQLWNPILVCPEEGELTRACRRSGVEVRTLPVLPLCSTSFWINNHSKLPNPFAWLWNAVSILANSGRLARFLRELGPDLVITKGLLCHFYGGLAANRAGIPCLWYVQDQISERFRGIYKTVFGMLAGRIPRRIAAIGPQIIRQLPRGLQGEARVVYNPVDTVRFEAAGLSKAVSSEVRRELGIPGGAMVIGNAARLTPWKGQHYLIEAFQQVAAVEPEARLLLIGGSLFGEEAYARRLKKMVAELGLEDRVIFTGHRQDVDKLLSAVDVFAYCALEKDICPLSLLEAMSAGLPIAAFDIDGVREAIREGIDGLLAPAGNPRALAETLLALVRNPALRRRLGESATNRSQSQFSVSRHVRGMEQVFEEALAAR
jgi:glycosyltransferase involved in cell wall biosynthesis